MKQIQIFIIIGATALLMAACSSTTLTSRVTEERETSSFTKVDLSTSADVDVQFGEREQLVITGDQESVERIRTSVRSDTLNIETRRGGFLGLDWLLDQEDVKITLTVRELEGFGISGSGAVLIEPLMTEEFDVDISGSGTLLMDGLVTERLDVDISGSGDVKITGQADEQRIDISGSGEFHGANLTGQIAEIDISGSGSVTTWVEEELHIDINGSGDVDYYGNPTLSQSISGSGSVSSKGERE